MKPQSQSAHLVDDEDVWFEWLRSSRHGGVPEYAEVQLPQIHEIRDRVLAGAEIGQNAVVADVGCGDGLMGLAVLAANPSAHVIFIDISQALIEQAYVEAEKLDALKRCEFIVRPLQSLEPLRDMSVDVVFARAVLAYVQDKAAAVNEIFRILKPPGQVSLADPIFQDKALFTAELKRQVNLGEATPRTSFIYRCLAAQYPDSLDGIGKNFLTNYNERTLVALFEFSGFIDIRLRLHIDILQSRPMPWEAFIKTKPYAGIPSIQETLDKHFSETEKREFENLFHDMIVGGGHAERNIVAYMNARKPM